jgi:hypothetical protein
VPIHPKTTSISSFKGLNNVLLPEKTPIDYLKRAVNIDLDKVGGVSVRKGYTLKDAGNYISLWASENSLGCYANKDGSLVRIKEDYTTDTLTTGLGPFKTSFEEVDDTVYYVSHNTSGTIKDGVAEGWGVERNYLSPSLSISGGTLPRGEYQVSFTYVNANGIESGASRASLITVPDNSGITLSIPSPTDPTITHSRIYCSTQNGSTLYFYNTSPLNSTITISSQENLISPLITFNLDRPPLGQIVRYYRGRLYIASANTLFYTEPFMYHHVNMAKNFFEFPEDIKEIMPVEDGIWIGSDKLYYLSGIDPSSFKRTTKEHIKVVSGTSTKVSGSYLRLDNTPIGYKWLVASDLGIFVLFNQGLVINMTSSNVSLDRADEGTGLFLQTSGFNSYLSILKNNGKESNTSFGDMVETTIVRNGVVIP